MKHYTEVADLVHQEIDRQDMKWGADSRQHPFVWNAILTEEVGEFAQAALQTEYGGKHSGMALEEIIQVAAVAMQIANDLLIEQQKKGSEEWIPHAQANQISELDDDDICPECGGSGEVTGDYFSDDGMSPCARCNGKGGEK